LPQLPFRFNTRISVAQRNSGGTSTPVCQPLLVVSPGCNLPCLPVFRLAPDVQPIVRKNNGEIPTCLHVLRTHPRHFCYPGFDSVFEQRTSYVIHIQHFTPFSAGSHSALPSVRIVFATFAGKLIEHVEIEVGGDSRR
ncbi:MAG: hypothetical protein RL226_386, partial [Bacteroidota bacterium]